MLKKLRNYFGFGKPAEITGGYPENFDFVDNLDMKTEYLTALEAQEASRLNTIETKTSQLIGQTSIIFSILSLFISNYITKFGTLPFVIQTVLLLVFLTALLLYLSTIFQATKYLNISKYSYGQRSIETVKARYSSDGFKVEQIKDLLFSIERNTQLTNLKSSNLIYAYRSFKMATILVGLLSVMLVFMGYFSPKESTPKVNIDGPVIVRSADTVRLDSLRHAISHSKDAIIIVHDTVYIRK